MTDTFAKTLHSVLTGARKVEEFCHVLVSSATEDALLCVARDYGHDYGALLRRYKDEVVRRHASGSSVDGGLCRGTTKGGKHCPKKAVLQGYCQQHAAAVAKDASRLRQVEAYAASIRPTKFESEIGMLGAGGEGGPVRVPRDVLDL
jgi:hypothetical protein